jgi:hypothetical protein
MGLLDAVKTPIGAVLLLVVAVALAAVTVAASISGALTAAAVGAAGLLTIVFILALIRLAG